jgi:ParB family chromosome partitioning protein
MPREFRRISVELLDEPQLQARIEIDDVELDELCRSIRELGLIEPLVVKPKPDGRFEIVAGHRRLLALRRVGVGEADCVVDAREELHEAVKLDENLIRRDLTAVDEATFYAELYEQLGLDVDRVAERVKKTRTYVEGRLLLLQGYDEVLDALRKGQISLGVAQAFNRIRRIDDVRYYLGFAVSGGVSVRLANQWADQANLRAQLDERAPAEPVSGGEGAPVATPQSYAPSPLAGALPYELSGSIEPRPCLYCSEVSEEYRMLRKFVCVPCAQQYNLRAGMVAPPPRARPLAGGDE